MGRPMPGKKDKFALSRLTYVVHIGRFPIRGCYFLKFPYPHPLFVKATARNKPDLWHRLTLLLPQGG